MDAVTHVPTPTNETVLDYAPGQPGAGRARGGARRGRPPRSDDLPHTIGGEPRRWASGEQIEVRQPHAHAKVLGVTRGATKADAGAAVDAAMAAAPAWRDLAFDDRAAILLKAADLLAGPVARRGQRRDDAGPEQDGLPGRDRRRVRAHRLLALQRALRPPDPRGAAAGQLARHVEPQRLPLARGLRLRDHAVQLHRDRRQPADRARAHGQHGRVEAVAHAAARRAVVHGAARGGRDAARRHQPRHRARAPRSPTSSLKHPEFAGLHFTGSTARLPGAVAADRRRTSPTTGTTRGSSARPAARTSSSPTRAPTPTCVRTAMMRGAFEYQGQKCSAASRAYVPRCDLEAPSRTTWPSSPTG